MTHPLRLRRIAHPHLQATRSLASSDRCTATDILCTKTSQRELQRDGTRGKTGRRSRTRLNPRYALGSLQGTLHQEDKPDEKNGEAGHRRCSSAETCTLAHSGGSEPARANCAALRRTLERWRKKARRKLGSRLHALGRRGCVSIHFQGADLPDRFQESASRVNKSFLLACLF